MGAFLIMSAEYISHSIEETGALAKKLARRLSPGDVILFYGGLGAGKTTFTKKLAEGLNIKDHVHSPTFTLVHEYKGDINLYHIDLYRLERYEEIMNIGFEDYVYSDGITVVEWSEKLGEHYLKGVINIKIETIGENERKFTLWSDIKSYNEMLEDVVKCIS